MQTIEPGLLTYAFALQYYETLKEVQVNKIEAAYQQAIQLDMYSSVSQYTSTGIQEGVESPAIQNKREYFAKISESYFSISDYYPFSYEELREYDPGGFILLAGIWGIRMIKDYSPVNDHGFTLMIRKYEAGNEQVVNAVSKAFQTLKTMSDSINEDILGILRARPLWIEFNNGNDACFHPNKLWILENGHVPEKAHCIEITNATNFNKQTAANQPLIVWYELSHYFHYHDAGWDNNIIRSAYENAVATGLYLNVEYIRVDGTVIIRDKAYALENEKEYFAELSEAYWGKNDFYPFTRDQLLEYDTVGYKMVQKLWQINN